MSSIAPKIFYKAENMDFQVLSFLQGNILDNLKVHMLLKELSNGFSKVIMTVGRKVIIFMLFQWSIWMEFFMVITELIFQVMI